ncbi:MAG: hypothetical protein A3J24_02705 [Deltaproteobacteria bacterium RIFCSPLOWO2_02_FULL_53_8]|nr:MAG: hypothetical protein A3J24_02705 [Deltaproteobacteria bacterium RIFCSPLOWO2_02_FULL_53_8]
MPSKTTMKNAAIAARSAALPNILQELIDQFVTGPMTGEAVNVASMAFKKAPVGAVLNSKVHGGLLSPTRALFHKISIAGRSNSRVGVSMNTSTLRQKVQISAPR